MKKEFETMWVLKKDENTHQLIKAHKFNPELHKKLFLKNLIKESIEKIRNARIDINNNQLLVAIIGAIVGAVLTIILSVIFLK